MKKVLLLGLALALVSGAAYANYCARDYVPAATLLVPYAVVDLNADGTPNNAGYTTLFAVTNVSSTRQIIHVTVWDPLSIAVVDFDEVLSGYDVWTINFRDLFTGHFDYFDTEGSSGFWYTPASKPGPFPPSNTKNYGPAPYPWGPTTNTGYTTTLPQPQDRDITTLDSSVGCQFPYGYHPEYGQGIWQAIKGEIEFIAQAPIGGMKWFCGDQNTVYATPAWITNLNLNRMFFYVTVDLVNVCSVTFPDSPNYWAAGGIPKDGNVLIGDIIYVNFSTNYSESWPAVSIESDPQAKTSHYPWNGLQFVTFYHDVTFYTGTPTAPWGVDDREPLGTAYAFRYLTAGGVSSDLVVWKTTAELEAFVSGGHTYYFWDWCQPYIYFAWDENENSKSRSGGPSGFGTPEPNELPLETQDVPLTLSNFRGLMDGNGWMLLVFDPSISGPPPYSLFSPSSYPREQAWAGVRYLLGGYSTSLEAATMSNVWCFGEPVFGQYLPQLSTVYNYTDGNHVPALW